MTHLKSLEHLPWNSCRNFGWGLSPGHWRLSTSGLLHMAVRRKVFRQRVAETCRRKMLGKHRNSEHQGDNGHSNSRLSRIMSQILIKKTFVSQILYIGCMWYVWYLSGICVYVQIHIYIDTSMYGYQRACKKIL